MDGPDKDLGWEVAEFFSLPTLGDRFCLCVVPALKDVGTRGGASAGSVAGPSGRSSVSAGRAEVQAGLFAALR